MQSKSTYLVSMPVAAEFPGVPIFSKRLEEAFNRIRWISQSQRATWVREEIFFTPGFCLMLYHIRHFQTTQIIEGNLDDCPYALWSCCIILDTSRQQRSQKGNWTTALCNNWQEEAYQAIVKKICGRRHIHYFKTLNFSIVANV